METKDRFAGSLSTEYDLVHVMIPHYDEHADTVRDAIAGYASTIDKSSLLAVDLGCGTGMSSRRILNADERITLIAIDNEAAMLEQAGASLEIYGDRISLREKDALDALRDLDAESIDIVASGNVLHNLPPEYRVEIMHEISRVLVSGGLFVNADKLGFDDSAMHARTLKEQLDNLFEFDKMGRPDLREAWHAHYLEDEDINFTEGEQRGLLNHFQFRSIEMVYRKRLEATIMAIKR